MTSFGMKLTPTSRLIRPWRRWRLKASWEREPPVLVTGMQKSGTTAIAMLLGAALGRRVCSDPLFHIDPTGTVVLDSLFAGEIGWGELINARPEAFAGGVLKDPDLIYFLPELDLVFPHSKRIFVVRHPAHTIRSVLNRLRLPGRVLAHPESRAFSSLSHFWQQILYGNTPSLPGNNYIECLAHRWKAVTRRYLDRRGDFTLVVYEAFQVNKTGYLRDLVSRLGLSLVGQYERIVDQQFQPAGDNTAAIEDFFGAENLGVICSICRPELITLGQFHGEFVGICAPGRLE